MRNFVDIELWTLEEAQSFEIIGTRKSFNLHDNKIVLLVCKLLIYRLRCSHDVC